MHCKIGAAGCVQSLETSNRLQRDFDVMVISQFARFSCLCRIAVWNGTGTLGNGTGMV